MPFLTLALDLDDPFVSQEVTTALAVALRQSGYTVQPAQQPPDANQPMGGSFLEIGQQVLDNKEFYTAGFNAITTIVKVLHERHQARVKAQQEEREVTLTRDEERNAALLRDLILGDAPLTITVTDQR